MFTFFPRSPDALQARTLGSAAKLRWPKPAAWGRHFFFACLFLAGAPFAQCAAPAALPFGLKSVSGSWLVVEDDDLLTRRVVVQGKSGLALLPETAGDFALTLRLRFDELRFQIRVPACGLAFSAQDARNLHAVVLDQNSGQLHVQRTVNGRMNVVASSAKHAFLPVGEWWWLRVERSGAKVSAALSRDGAIWLANVTATLAPEVAGGRLGLIADIPGTRFDLAEPPSRALRDRGEWIQTSDGKVQLRLREETFVAPGPLQRRIQEVNFSPESKTTNVAGILIPNPALRDMAQSPSLPTPNSKTPPTIDEPVSSPTVNDYVAAMHRVGKVVPRDGYRLLGAALAAGRTKDAALLAELRTATSGMLEAFKQSGEVPRGFSQVYAAFRALEVILLLDEKAAPDAAAVSQLVTRTLTVGAYERGAMNRALGMAGAIAPGLSLAPDHPERAALLRTRELVLSDFAAHAHQPLEDSTNYQLISLFFALNLALDDSSLGWERQPNFRAAFDHLVALLGTDGNITAFGDDYTSHPGMLLGLFETAARVWSEPRFRGAAALVYARHFAGGRLPDNLVGEDFLGLGLAAAQVDPSLGPAPVIPECKLIIRAQDGKPTKLVLTSNQRENDFAAVFDLINGTEHGHHDALALVGTVAQGQSLLPDAGRYARDAQFHNRLVVVDAAADFPLRADTGEQSRRMLDPVPVPGEWRTWRLALRQHWVWGNFAGDLGLPALQRDQYHPDIPSEFRYDPARQFALLFEVKGEGRARFEFADVRLTGGTTPERHLSEYPTKQEASFGPNSKYLGAVLPGSLDLKTNDHEWLEFRMRVIPAEGDRALVNSVVIGDIDGYPKRYVPPDSPSDATCVQHWEKTPWGARATLETNYVLGNEQRVPVTRQILFVAGRALAIRDTVTNTGATPRHAGPVWHVSNATLTTPSECFLAGSRLRIRVLPSTGAVTTLRQHAVTGVLARQVFSQMATLAPGEKRSFETLLLPPDRGVAPRPAVRLDADGLHVEGQPTMAW